MSLEISERSFEDAIEAALLEFGPDALPSADDIVREVSPPYSNTPPGGYHKRRSEEYDRALCLVPRDVLDFVLATQPKEWQKLAQHHGAAVKDQFLKRLAGESNGAARSMCCATASRTPAASSSWHTSGPPAA